MERPRDDHKLTHNMRLATRDKLFGGTVSRLQVGGWVGGVALLHCRSIQELLAACVASPELAENTCLGPALLPLTSS